MGDNESQSPDHEHHLVTVEAKAPTCYESGWEEYRYCKNCDYSEKKEIPTIDHTVEKEKCKTAISPLRTPWTFT